MSVNFALILLVLCLITGATYFADLLVYRKRRLSAAQAGLQEFDQSKAKSIRAASGEEAVAAARAHLEGELMRSPWWVEYCASFFPVLAFVFILRSFLFEPFRIPSASMLPTLEAGDFILVNKYTYGVRLPVANTKVINLGTPKRGDVMVFRWPKNTAVDFIKRVVAVPGDKIEYRNKQLTINGQLVPTTREKDYLNPENVSFLQQFSEKLGEVNHKIVVDDTRVGMAYGIGDFPGKENCVYNTDSLVCTVPTGHYFVLGDNRDNSEDSRYWGFVPDANIVGRAFYIWMNSNGQFSRIGSFN